MSRIRIMSNNKLAASTAFIIFLAFLSHLVPYIYKHTISFSLLVFLLAVLRKQSIELEEVKNIEGQNPCSALILYRNPEIDHLSRLLRWQKNRYAACIRSGVELAGLADNYRLKERITKIVDNAELRSQRKQLEAAIEAEKTAASALKRTIARQHQRIGRSSRRNTRLVVQSRKEIEVLTEENADRDLRAGQIKDELESARGQVSSLQQRIAELEARVNEQAENIAAKDNRISELEGELFNTRQHENDLLQQVGELEERAQSHDDQRRAFEDDLHSMVEDAEEASQRIGYLENENAVLRQGLRIVLPRVGLGADLDALEAVRQLVELRIAEASADQSPDSAETDNSVSPQPLLAPDYGKRDDVLIDEQNIDALITDGLTTEVLGEGTYAMVRRWRNPGTNNGLPRMMAIKITKLDNVSDIRNDLLQVGGLFKQEAKLLCRLRHENIVACRLWKVCNDGVSMAALLDYKEGDLIRAIQNGQYLDPHDGFNLIGDVSNALMYLHSQGIVHLDIKPENIYYHVDGEKERACFGLLDFNLASEEKQVTSSGDVGGTPMYMAPEFAHERQSPSFSTKSDIYSCFVTLTHVCNFGGLGLHESDVPQDPETHAHAVDIYGRQDERAQDWADVGDWSPEFRPSAATLWNRWRLLSQLPRELHELWPEDRPRRNRALAQVFKAKSIDARKSFMKFHGVLYDQLEEYLHEGLRNSIMEPGL